MTLDRAPFVDDPSERERLATVALSIARRFGDRDLEFSAMALLGDAYVGAGRVAEGMTLLDETMAAVSGGEVNAVGAIGEIFCRTSVPASAPPTCRARSSGWRWRDAPWSGPTSSRRRAGSITAGS
jgi:hypothetical protein